MAGWIKMEKTTPDKPEIMAIADMLGMEPDHAFGKCFRFWAWVDDHLTAGNAPSVTARRIDMIARCDGLAKALQKVGWIQLSKSGVTVTNFHKHFGESAKQRALTAQRVAEHRNKNRSDPVTPEPLPDKRREDKSREDLEESTSNTESNGKLVRPKGRTPATYHEAFEIWWKAYPLKIGKKAAYTAWQRAGKGIKLASGCSKEDAAAKLQAACEAFAASPKGKGKFVPHPSAWLNQGRWDDDPKAWQDSGQRAPRNGKPVLDINQLFQDDPK